MKSSATIPLLLASLCALVQPVIAAEGELPADVYQDRVRGAWAGQFFGRAYAAQSNLVTHSRLKSTPAGLPEVGTQSLFHVQLIFLKTLEKYGGTATRNHAAELFRGTEFPLAHASDTARKNLRRGMLPTSAGHPRFNPHSDDNDFQAAAAVLGIIAPGASDQVSRWCDLFGGMMSYGDGLYGGRFLAAIYSQAFLEKDVTPEAIERCLRTALPAVHAESAYAAVGRIVLEQYGRDRKDWQKARAAIWSQWGERDLCPEGAQEPANFDAKLNGGFIMIGLLYGQGNIAQTLEITAGCGQQVRENCAAAAGVLGTLLGFREFCRGSGSDEAAFGAVQIGGQSFLEIVRACELVARKSQNSGESGPLRFTRQAPAPPAELEQMYAAFNRKQIMQWNKAASAVFFDKMPQWDAEWELVSCGFDGAPSVRSFQGKSPVLVTHPVDKVEPAILQRSVHVPLKNPRLLLTVASFPDAATDDKKSIADWLLRVVADGKPILEKIIDTEDRWEDVTVDLTRYAGQTIVLSLENAPGGGQEYAYETAYWARAKVVGE